MSSAEHLPRTSLINQANYTDEYELRLKLFEAYYPTAFEPIIYRRILPDDVRTLSAFALQTVVSIIEIDNVHQDYSQLHLLLADPGYVQVIHEGPKIKKVNFDVEGNIFNDQVVPRGRFRRPRIDRYKVGYLMHADPEWKEMNQEISAQQPFGGPQSRS